MNERHPIPVTEIVAALEREAVNTDTDPRWIAAEHLRHMVGWESRTLMCRIDSRPSTLSTVLETRAINSPEIPEGSKDARACPAIDGPCRLDKNGICRHCRNKQD